MTGLPGHNAARRILGDEPLVERLRRRRAALAGRRGDISRAGQPARRVPEEHADREPGDRHHPDAHGDAQRVPRRGGTDHKQGAAPSIQRPSIATTLSGIGAAGA